MENQIAGIPVLQKTKETKHSVIKAASSCCSKPVNASTCCTPLTGKEKNTDACCVQPEDGSACCNK